MIKTPKNILRYLVPNGITAVNLFLGMLATYYAFNGYSPTAANLIIIAAILDFFDGFSARILNAQSEFGKQFDSLADLVSFGVAPAAILYDILSFDFLGWKWMFNNENILPLFVFIIPVFSAIRLARFNIDTEQKQVFKGLPTPANALIIASFPLMMMNLCHCSPLFQEISNTRNILIYVVLVSVWMNLNIPMLSLKFKDVKIKGNLFRYLFILFTIIISILLLFVWNYEYGFVLAAVMGLYLLFSLLGAVLCNKNKKKGAKNNAQD